MPKVLDIVKEPAKSLRKPSQAVDVAQIGTPEFQAFLDDLGETMFAADGVGIAAPQVGSNIRVFVVNEKDKPVVYINPVVEVLSEAVVESEEGCLSVPGIWGIVPRAKKIRLKAYDRHGRRIEVDAKGYSAIIIQHEFDHLQGILFVDKMTHATKGTDKKAV